MRQNDPWSVVVGGVHGIGRALVDVLSQRGQQIVVADTDTVAGQELVSTLNSNGHKAIFEHLDVGEESQILRFVGELVKKNIIVGQLYLCPGYFVGGGFASTSEEWMIAFRVNVLGSYLVIKHLRDEACYATSGASIVLISSISALIAQTGYIAYNTTKASILNMVRCLALELAPKGVRVNSVCPSTVWTKNNEFYMGRDSGLDRAAADEHPSHGGGTMLRRVAEPVEIAKVMAFLGSSDASYVNAQNVIVDGGYLSFKAVSQGSVAVLGDE